MSTIRLFDPVYIVPDRSPVAGRDGASVEPRLVWIQNKPDRIQIDFEKQAWKNLWVSTCNHVINFAEFVFDFGQGTAYSITPKELVGSRFIQVRNDPNHKGWNLLQGISLVAVGILTLGIGLVALLWLKDYHHGQVTQAETQAAQAFEHQTERKKKESIISLFDDVEQLLNKYIKVFGLNKTELKDMTAQIQNYKRQALDTKKKSDPVKLSSTLRERLPNAILTPLRNKLSIEVGKSIGRTQEAAEKNASNTKQEIKLQNAKEIQAELQAIQVQIDQILYEEKTPKTIVDRCNGQLRNLEFTKDINDGVFKGEEIIAVKYAKLLFAKMLTTKRVDDKLIKIPNSKIIKVPDNGSCLLLCLICSSNIEIKNDPDLWNAMAFDLRQRLVGLLRAKIENGEDEGFLLKAKIQSEMADIKFHAGYTQELKDKIVKKGAVDVAFVESEKENEGWQAYLQSLENPATFLGEVELSVLPELMQANILVYEPNLDRLPIKRDDENRLHVFSPTFANQNSENYVFSKEDRDQWVASHKTENGMVLPAYTIPEKTIKNYDKEIRVILLGNHYNLLIMPSEDEGQGT